MFRLNKRWQSDISMLVVSLIWGTTFVVVKDALNDIGPFWFIGLRFIIAFFTLAIVTRLGFRSIGSATWYSGAVLGLFLFIGYASQTIGLKYTTATNAGFITGVSVVLVPIIYSILTRHWPAFSTIVTVATAITGLFLLSFQYSYTRLASGDLLIMICALGFSLHIVYVDRYSHKHNPVAITAVQILLVGILSIIIGMALEPWPVVFTYRAGAAIVVTSIFATALAFLVQNFMQKYSTPTRFAIVLTTEPIFTALTAYIWAGETLSRQGLAGGGIIILSMIISILTRKEKNLVEANV